MHSIQYTLLGCRLHLLGQGVEDGDNSTVTELKQLTLELEDHVRLTGSQLHLEALVQTLLPYARHIISGQAREFTSTNGMVAITPFHRGHRLRFQKDDGSQGNHDVQLDDGELANVVRCLDAAILDPRLQVDITAPPMQGLRERELRNRLPLGRRLAAPVGGLALTMALVGLGFLVPVPERFRVTDPTDSEAQQEGDAAVELIEEQSLPIELNAETINPEEGAATPDPSTPPNPSPEP